jgi:DNA-directed RNA polymerase specialized sigma24 family protein
MTAVTADQKTKYKSLPDLLRKTIERYCVRGQSVIEIARQDKLTTKAVYQRIERAEKLLDTRIPRQTNRGRRPIPPHKRRPQWIDE